MGINLVVLNFNNGGSVMNQTLCLVNKLYLRKDSNKKQHLFEKI